MEQNLYIDPNKVRQYKIKQIITKIFVYSFLVIIGLFIIIPFYWMLITSLKSPSEVTGAVITLFPKEPKFGNYIEVFRRAPMLSMYLNTIMVGAITTAFTVVSVVLTAFAFSRLNFKGRDLIFSVFLLTMMIPGEIFVITNYMTLSKLGWVRSRPDDPLIYIIANYAALILPFITSVFYTFFLRQTFKQIPNELYLAAKVDGVGDFKYLRKIMIPVASSTIITIIILSMIGTWNAYIWPSLVTDAGNKGMFLVSNGLLDSFKSASELDGPNSIWNLQMAGSALVTMPLLVAFMLLKKYILRGVSRSGIKG